MDVLLILQLMPQVFPGALVSSGFHPLMLISGNNCLYFTAFQIHCFVGASSSKLLQILLPFLFLMTPCIKLRQKKRAKKEVPHDTITKDIC